MESWWHSLSRLLATASLQVPKRKGKGERGDLPRGAATPKPHEGGAPGPASEPRPAPAGRAAVRRRGSWMGARGAHARVPMINTADCQELATSHARNMTTSYVSSPFPSPPEFPCKGHEASRMSGRRMGRIFALLRYDRWFRQYLHSWFQWQPCSENTFFIPVMRHVWKTRIPNTTS